MQSKSALAVVGASTSAWVAAAMYAVTFAAVPAAAQTAAPAAAPPAVTTSSTAPSTNVAPATETPPSDPGSAKSGEPNVKYTVIEDEGSKIEELKVRGSTQRITVTPKVGIHKSYEILTGDGSRDLGFAANTSRGVVGQRVWNVLKF